MRAFKCNRCSKYFTSDEGGINIYYYLHREEYDIATSLKRDDNEMDLCNDCYEKFLSFLKEYTDNSIFNERGKEMLRKIGADKEPLTEGYLGKV